MLRDSPFCLPITATIRETIASIDRNNKGIVLIVDAEHRLLGTITDGDVRRAILAGANIDSPIEALLAKKLDGKYSKPITAAVSATSAELLHLMHTHRVYQIPLVDTEGRIRQLVTMNDLLPEEELPLRAVVMAGGFGARLKPLTDAVPKPMLPVGGRPLLERVIHQLSRSGIRRLHLTTHYKKEVIAEHFGDGAEHGVAIQYVEEGEPLGTAGVLGLVEAGHEPLLVINGDILTEVDFAAMHRFHCEHEALMTVGVCAYEISVPYGVVEIDGVHVSGVVEKPVQRCFINAGIYLLDPEACRMVPHGQASDMPDLINTLIAEGKRVISFPIHEYWLDIGHYSDYERAQEDVKNGKFCNVR
ncbi:MAG: nucleotidyltransferase family protein [Deltaproteobacteria bacterium]|nr:nucleotidyltransferase family protein [Deltaproteobacteria bacterium]